MRFKIIACNVFLREIALCASQSAHTIETEFLEKNAHEQSDRLRELLQARIDIASKNEAAFDAILLGYGLCGNATAGLVASTIPLVMPRAHDCGTLFLGSKDVFHACFAHRPSTPFTSAGYMEAEGTVFHDSEFESGVTEAEEYADYVVKYGEDNAAYLWETLHGNPVSGGPKEIVYINVPEFSQLGHAERCRREAKARGWNFCQVDGDLHLLRSLVDGQWDEREFLVIAPGEKIKAVYDWQEIVRAAR